MAKMHTRRRGASSSKRPVRDNAPSWVQFNAKDIETKIVEYYKEGLLPSQIGFKLRDVHAVPNIKEITGKSVVQILKENGCSSEIPENLMMLMKKAVNINRHLNEGQGGYTGRNIAKKDLHNKRSLTLVEAKIRRLVRYYHQKDELPENWKYTIENAKLLVE